MRIFLDLLLEENKWNNYNRINKFFFLPIIEKVLFKTKFSLRKVSLCILLTNDQKMQILNNKFRNKNYSTNILAFPDTDIKLNNKNLYIGDIALSYQRIYKESNHLCLKFVDYLIYIIVHGLLHLVGYNHYNIKEEKIMQNLEKKIISSLRKVYNIKQKTLDYIL